MNTKLKYKNKWVTIDGIKFQSKAEGAYYQVYKEIIVEMQPKIYMTDAKILYKPDFLLSNGDYIDVKGMTTATFNLKARLWKHYAKGKLIIVKRIGNSYKFKTIKEIEGLSE